MANINSFLYEYALDGKSKTNVLQPCFAFLY